ncbi:hypothetical protein MO867_22130 [Microbulbifer sp. OS29]|uniref:Ribbon-helix-helix domain-containing protein n=1 Tax=Microbulbifer okhotskensis TaxID=2926617 RepID=A0A9X2EW60_9GAMM|nr:hypothetical protein [Microbulbifer okhotskensis]MCO1337026.1 hypothetical protein [Microbulbifer okhotskensis]
MRSGLECKSNLRTSKKTRGRIDALSDRFGIPREQLLRIILEASLPIFEAETPEDIKKAQAAQRILTMLRV